MDGKEFCWNWLPSTVSAGGILFGINLEVFEVSIWDVRTNLVSFHGERKSGGFKCSFTTIYGPTYEDHKDAFLQELKVLGEDQNPHIIRGILIW